METIDQSDENQVLSQTATQSAEKDAQVVTAATAEQGIAIDTDAEALPPVIASAGRSHFVPNTNPERMVTVITPPGDNNTLHVKRTSEREDVGATIEEKSIVAVFGNSLEDQPHKQQITVAMVNGMSLIGYLTKTKSRKGIYFPKKYLPESFPLPQQGTLQPIVIAKIIIG